MIVYLVPVGRGRFEPYSEAHEEASQQEAQRDADAGSWIKRASARWHEWVERARRGSGQGRIARWRDAAICRLAESVAEQRTLWALRDQRETTVRFPSSLDATRARTVLMDLLAHAKRHHQRWLVIDGVLLLASAPLAVVPGPQLLAYYLAFRIFGHVQSWRGARQGIGGIVWTFEADTGLAELASLADIPRETRAPRVKAIAERLNLRRLSAFFDRVAVRSG